MGPGCFVSKVDNYLGLGVFWGLKNFIVSSNWSQKISQCTGVPGLRWLPNVHTVIMTENMIWLISCRNNVQNVLNQILRRGVLLKEFLNNSWDQSWHWKNFEFSVCDWKMKCNWRWLFRQRTPGAKKRFFRPP